MRHGQEATGTARMPPKASPKLRPSCPLISLLRRLKKQPQQRQRPFRTTFLASDTARVQKHGVLPRSSQCQPTAFMPKDPSRGDRFAGRLSVARRCVLADGTPQHDLASVIIGVAGVHNPGARVFAPPCQMWCRKTRVCWYKTTNTSPQVCHTCEPIICNTSLLVQHKTHVTHTPSITEPEACAK